MSDLVIMAYVLFAALTVAVWVPILLRFFRAWNTRGNPVSLAIVGMVMLIIWMTVAGIWLVGEAVSGKFFAFVSTSISAYTGLWMHWSFYQSKKKFPEQRAESEGIEPCRSARRVTSQGASAK